MKNTAIKLAAFLLTLITVITLISGCADEKPPEPGTTAAAVSDTEPAATTPETAYIDTLEKRDFGNETFTVIGQSSSDRQNFYNEDKAGEPINESIRRRDFAVEERLNLKLEYIAQADRKKVATLVHAATSVNDATYDLVITSLSDGINTLATGGDLCNLFEIPGLSLESVYWNQSMTVNMEMYGKLYFTTGPISPQLYQTPIVMTENKKLAEDYKLEDPYKVVLENRWTIDKLYEMIKDVSYDFNNDTVMDSSDFWGLVVDPTFGNALYVGAGLEARQLVDGKYRLAIGDEAFVNLVDKCASLFGDRSIVLNNPQGKYDYDLDIFKPGRALFMDNTVLGVIGIRDMDDDFAIIPCPKATLEQEKYYTTCNTWLPSGVAVPFTGMDKAEDIGLIMETMAYYSYEEIMPAVYEIMLRGRVSRTADDWKTLDIIFENLSFDFVSVFNPGGASDKLRNAMIGELENYVSEYASIARAAQRELDNFAAVAKKQK